MGTQVFPTLAGLAYPVEREIEWNNAVQETISGKETRVAYWATARYKWTVALNFLRSSTAFNEFQNLWGFVSARQGRFDTFLYTDVEDFQASSQSLGQGDSTNLSFQLLRQFGGSSAIIEPVLAPNALTVLTVAGTSVSSTTFTVNGWGTTAPGTIAFSTPPANGAAIAATFSYYFPVRFDEDVLTFVNSMSKLWECKKLVFRSVK